MILSSAESLTRTVLPISSPKPDEASLRTLTTGLARGDDTAWARFHRDYGPGIYRQLLAATRGDQDLASEALQQTYLRIARHARPCGEPQVFASWLRTVARSALHDCWRRRRSFRDLLARQQADPSESLAEGVAHDALLPLLDAALAELAPEERHLLEAKYFSGASVRALSLQLNISEKALESRLTRARAELRQRLLASLPAHE